jgi:hypothetical protein
VVAHRQLLTEYRLPYSRADSLRPATSLHRPHRTQSIAQRGFHPQRGGCHRLSTPRHE